MMRRFHLVEGDTASMDFESWAAIRCGLKLIWLGLTSIRRRAVRVTWFVPNEP